MEKSRGLPGKPRTLCQMKHHKNFWMLWYFTWISPLNKRYRIKAVPDLAKMGYPTTALIGLQTAPGQLDAVADAITHMKDVHYVAITTGAFDVFACVAKPSTEELGIFLRTKIGTIPGVTRTETFVNLSIKKRTYGLVL